MKRALLLAGVLLLTPSTAQVSERPDSVAVAIYHSGSEGDPNQFRTPDPSEGLAFITETRTIDVPAGPATIELRGVAATIIPQSAGIEGLPVRLTERNFDYDLLSPGALIRKSVGDTVTLIRTDKKTGKQSERNAVLRTGPQGVLLDFGNSVEALDCSGLPEKIVFSKVPEGLRDTPTLSIRTDAREAGRYTVKLSYLATAVNWGVDYVARLNGKTLDLSGWVTLVNAGETGFKNVPLDIVAGNISRNGDADRSPPAPLIRRGNLCWPTQINWATAAILAQDIGMLAPRPAPPPALIATRAKAMDMETVAVTGFRAARDLGDYKLYSLNGETDILAKQIKQVQLLDQKDVPFERYYYFDAEARTALQPARYGLRLKNTKESHLGLPLPSGMFTATEITGEGAPVVLGRQNFRDYSTGSPIELEIGPALDIYVASKVVGVEKRDNFWGKATRTTTEYTVTNNKAVSVDFELHQAVQEGVSVASESERHTVTANGMVWAFKLNPGQARTIRVAFDAR